MYGVEQALGTALARAQLMKPRPPRNFPARPSSLELQRILTVHRNINNQLPTRIWPHLSSDDDDDDDRRQPADKPLLTLNHPLLRALETCPPGASPQLDSVHAQLLLHGLAHHPLAAGRAIKKLSSLPSSLPLAVSYFASLHHPDAFISNTILRSFLSSGFPHRALSFYYQRVLNKFITPNHYTFPLLAKVFAELGRAWDGVRAHAQAMKLGLHSDLFTKNSFIHMYSCFRDIDAACRVFDSGGECDLVTWNSMISTYVKNGMLAEARRLFDKMPERDVVSWNVIVAGHAAAGDMDAAVELFSVMPRRDIVSWNSVIDGYARMGEAKLARKLFDQMPNWNLVSWNVMLALYARSKEYRECLKLFDAMMAVGDVRPDEATFVSVLTACAHLGELDRGKWVHSLIRDSKREIEPDVLLSTALLTMYAKCGAMATAREIFDQMEEKSVVSWNSMIIGYGMHGQGDKALEVFFEMERKGSQPNETTFVCILSACTHAGMVLEGWWCFNQMIRSYGIKPQVEHFGCMVDLLGRAGLLKDIEELVKKMPLDPAPALWGALLSASRAHTTWDLGVIVGKKLIELNPNDIGSYVLLSNIYAVKGRWDDVEKVREKMRENGLQKAAGVSLVDLNGSGSDRIVEEKISDNKKSMVYSLLSEMGACMKLSCRNFDLKHINYYVQ